MKSRQVSSYLLLVLLVSGCVSQNPQKPVDQSKLLQAQIDLGVGYIRNGDFARAKYNLNKALKLDSESAVAHNAMATVFQSEGDDELAELHFRQAVRFGDDFSQARNNFGAFLYEKGRYQDAIEQLRVAAEDRFYPGRPQAYENLAVCHVKLNQVSTAEGLFKRALELNRSLPRSLLEMAVIRFEQRDYAGAVQFLNRYMTVGQQTPRSIWLGIQIARQNGDDDREASYSMMLRNMYPRSEEARRLEESKQ